MWHYIHHIVFDPLSAWEKFKVDMLGSLLVLLLIALLYGGCFIWAWIEDRLCQINKRAL